jgi:hypothetical protein
MTRAVEDSVNVESFASDREEDTIWKAICENAPDVTVATNDAKQFRIISGSIERSQYLID